MPPGTRANLWRSLVSVPAAGHLACTAVAAPVPLEEQATLVRVEEAEGPEAVATRGAAAPVRAEATAAGAVEALVGVGVAVGGAEGAATPISSGAEILQE